MAGVSGIFGDVLIGPGPSLVQVADIKKWSYTLKTNIAKWGSNKTAGWKNAVSGTSDSSGSVECIWDPSVPITTVLVAVDGIHVGSGVGIAALFLQTFTGQSFTLDVVFNNVKVDVDLDNGDPVTWTSDFEGILKPALFPVATASPGPGLRAQGNPGHTPALTAANPDEQRLINEALAAGFTPEQVFNTASFYPGPAETARRQQLYEEVERRREHTRSMPVAEFQEQKAWEAGRKSFSSQEQPLMDDVRIARIVRDVLAGKK